MIRRRLATTPFPYTTLFRSSVAKPAISTFHSFCVRVLRRDIEALRIPSAAPGTPPIGHTKSFVIYDESDQQQVVKAVDRKSTRLNSSHGSSSYAVFCLKKTK